MKKRKETIEEARRRYARQENWEYPIGILILVASAIGIGYCLYNILFT